MRIRSAAGAALVLGLAACGNPSPAPQEKAAGKDPAAVAMHTTAEAGPAAATEAQDACNLVTTDELAAIFGSRSFTQDNMPPEKRNKPGGPRRNAITSCTYVSTGASMSDMMTITVVLTTAYSDKAQPSLQQMQSGLSTLGVKFEGGPIEGVGDAGYWYNVGSDRRSAVVVNVMRNPRYWLTISESSSGQEEPVTISRLTDVARTALGRM